MFYLITFGRLFFSLLILMMAAGMNYSQSIDAFKKKAQNQTSKYDDIEFEAMIVDETQTKLGHDFFESFYSKYEVPEEFKKYSITVVEKPSPRLGTVIVIMLNDLEIYQGFLQPKLEYIEEVASDAVETLMTYLENYDLIQNELQGDDMQGTGIH